MKLRLTELEPQFMQRNDDTHFTYVDSISEADGIIFLCPLCFENNNKSNIGVHMIICWNLSVPQTTEPTPGRWNLIGTGYKDLSLQADSSSILLTGDGCKWHGFITNGEVT